MECCAWCLVKNVFETAYWLFSGEISPQIFLVHMTRRLASVHATLQFPMDVNPRPGKGGGLMRPTLRFFEDSVKTIA